MNARGNAVKQSRQRYEAARANLFPHELKPKYLIYFTIVC